MSIRLSIVICSHNPRPIYLEKVIEGLQKQTLALSEWELLLIDNCSDRLLSSQVDLIWHPNSRHIRENQLGLAYARIRGIKESIGDVIIFVDDDNILHENYLEIVVNISNRFPFLGVWGGQSLPIFDKTPPEWTKPYWGLLSIYEFSKDSWSNFISENTNPHGAGMCVRRVVASKYCEIATSDPRHFQLGRKGNSLGCGEDTDIVLTGCDIGLGIGSFASLKLSHLIPPKRLQEEYLLQILEEGVYWTTILKLLRDDKSSILVESVTPKYKQIIRHLYYFFRMSRAEYIDYKREQRFNAAKERGYCLAVSKVLGK